MMLPFDYGEYGFKPSEAKSLDAFASSFDDKRWRHQKVGVKGHMALCGIIHAAKSLFRKKPDGTWAKYCDSKLNMSASTANKRCREYECFGKVDSEVLCAIPVAALYPITQATKAQQNKILKLAATKDLQVSDIKALIMPTNGKKEIAKTKIPGNRDELLELVEKQLGTVERRIEKTDLFEDYKDVLEEYIESLGVEDDEGDDDGE